MIVSNICGQALTKKVGAFIFVKGVVAMKLIDHLSEEEKNKLYKARRRKNKKKRGPYDNVNYEELMGTNRDQYVRRGGAIRRK